MNKPKENTLNPAMAALQGIGLVGLIILSYLGLNYIWSGSKVLPLVVSILGAVLIFIAVFLLVKMKNLKENKGVRPAEIALWVGYAVLAIASYFPIAHFANVEISAQRSIQTDALARLQELNRMSSAYRMDVDGRVDEVKQAIQKIASDIRAGGDPKAAAREAEQYGVSDPGKKSRDDLAAYYEAEAISKAKIYLAAATEAPAGENLAEREERYQVFIGEKSDIINRWDRGRIYETLNDVDSEVNDYDDFLTEMYVADNPSESYWDEQEFDYDLSGTKRIENIIDSPSVVREKYAEETGMLIPLGILVLLHLFVVSPYLFLSRLGKRRYYNRRDDQASGPTGGIEI